MATPRKSAPAPVKRASAPRKTATAAQAAPVSQAPIQLFTEASREQLPMVPLFAIDGVDYLIPAEPDAGMALRYIDAVRKGTSQEAAMADLLEGLLGPASYAALLAFKGHMSPTQVAQLFQAAQSAVMGMIELPKDD